ncbi:MAG TPA: hypothetical protein VFT38_21440 [Vicinamibacteria bacterium]|nr:hypothetical protein [Vicinamibacteria bacterium]
MAETGRRRGDVLDADCPSRQVLDRIADKWTALISAGGPPGERSAPRPSRSSSRDANTRAARS